MEECPLYSLNYLHAGAPKFWVVVHPHDGERLERRVRKAYHRPTGAIGAGDAAGPTLASAASLCATCPHVPVNVLDL